MDRVWKVVTGAAFSALAFALSLLGGWDAALGVMFLMMGLDVLSGLLVCLSRQSAKTPGGGFHSRALFAGLTRKMLMLAMVMLGTGLDNLMGVSLCRVTVIGFYAANEAFSVIENAAVAGVPFPKGLLALLEKYRAAQDARRDDGAAGDVPTSKKKVGDI